MGLHPFVDVLEGRELLSGSIEDGVFTSGRASEPAGPVAETSAPAYGVDGSSFFAGVAQLAIQAHASTVPADDHMPPVMDARPAGSTFSSTAIAEGDAALFANQFHDRRGRTAQRLNVEPERAEASATTFRQGRSLTGAMRPFVTMSVVAEEMPFAS